MVKKLKIKGEDVYKLQLLCTQFDNLLPKKVTNFSYNIREFVYANISKVQAKMSEKYKAKERELCKKDADGAIAYDDKNRHMFKPQEQAELDLFYKKEINEFEFEGSFFKTPYSLLVKKEKEFIAELTQTPYEFVSKYLVEGMPKFEAPVFYTDEDEGVEAEEKNTTSEEGKQE